MSLALLDQARERTRRFVDRLDDEAWRAWPHPDFSPICWHLGHLAFTEAFWVLARGVGDTRLSAPFARRYAQDGCPKHERADGFERGALLAYLDEVGAAVREALPRLDPEHPLTRDGYLAWFLACHEHQHRETMAIVRVLTVEATTPTCDGRAIDDLDDELGPTLTFARSRISVGTDDRCAYDNERPSVEVELGPFAIAARPVSHGAWMRFVRDEGYARRELWTDAGWAWLGRTRIRAPRSWRLGPGGWLHASLDGWRALEARAPVYGVSAHEADAFARWCGARLPTEDEWELAARTYVDDAPLLDLERSGPRALGASTDLLGNVWEWTSSTFAPREGFTAFPYRGYSEPWFGDHRVMRGGSFATHPTIATPSFRNFYLPEIRAGFVGLRLAWDR